MRTRSVRRICLFLFSAAILFPLFQTGCEDESKTTGTQVKISDEAKAQIQDMREMYKDTKGKTAKDSKQK